MAPRAKSEYTEQPPAPQLVRTEGGLALAQDGMELRGDFSRMLQRVKAANLSRELLVRAARVKGGSGPFTAIDATAGLGEDSFLLAAAGFQVALYERDPTIAALLADALERARLDPALAPIAARMSLVQGDSIDALRQLASRSDTAAHSNEDASPATRPDVIVLDPMFPAKQKSSAVKKKLQMIQQLERPCPDEADLLEAAVAACPRKVVVKRPAKGPYLAGLKPDYSLSGKAVRYDIIVVPRA